ncbi:MAG: hypothetical protein WKF94_03625 [Solirubrobacteraceae bacterium]
MKCGSCFASATHLLTGHYTEAWCEACASRRSAQARGEAYTAVTMLGYAALTAEGAGMTRDEIVATVDAALAKDGESWSVHIDDGLPDWAWRDFEGDTRFVRLPEAS